MLAHKRGHVNGSEEGWGGVWSDPVWPISPVASSHISARDIATHPAEWSPRITTLLILGMRRKSATPHSTGTTFRQGLEWNPILGIPFRQSPKRYPAVWNNFLISYGKAARVTSPTTDVLFYQHVYNKRENKSPTLDLVVNTMLKEEWVLQLYSLSHFLSSNCHSIHSF